MIGLKTTGIPLNSVWTGSPIWQFVAFTQELFIILLKVRDGRTRVSKIFQVCSRTIPCVNLNYTFIFELKLRTRAQVLVRNGIFTCLKFRFCPSPCPYPSLLRTYSDKKSSANWFPCPCISTLSFFFSKRSEGLVNVIWYWILMLRLFSDKPGEINTKLIQNGNEMLIKHEWYFETNVAT